MRALIPITCALLFVFSCARNPVTGKREVVLMSEAQEIELGKQTDPQVIAQFGLYPDNDLQQYIQQLGQRIVDVSHRKNIKYTFRVIDADFINAFAIPGGYVYFTRGIMGHLNNEAEFMGVLGHEIGHIAARHSVEQQRNQLFGQIGLIAGLVLVPDLAPYAESASQAMQLMFLKFSRDAERESDRLGVEYSSKLGYDAQKMANFFNTLKQKEGGSSLPEFLSTHPDPGNRYKTVSHLAQEWKQKLGLTNAKENRSNFLQKIDGIVYGEDPKQGFVENNVFYHPDLRFQFPIPSGWNHQNSPQAFQMAPQNGKALLMLTLAQGNSLSDAAAQAMQRYKLTPVDQQNVTINGLNALAVTADQQQQNGSVRTISYFIQHRNSILHLIGAASMQNFNEALPAFMSTIQQFRELTDTEKINRKAKRIKVVPANASTLSGAFAKNNVPKDQYAELAIVNGMTLDQSIEPGSMIKIIVQPR